MGPSKKPQDATRQERKAKKRKLEDAVLDLPGDDNDRESQDMFEGKVTKRKRDKMDDGGEGMADEDKHRKERRKEKKRKREEAEAGDEEGGVALESHGELDDVTVEKKKKSKKEQKSERFDTVELEIDAQSQEAPKKSKKERKAERRAREAAAAAASSKGKPVEEPKLIAEVERSRTSGNTASAEEKKSKKNNRNREKKRKSVTGSAKEGERDAPVENESKTTEKKDSRFICFIGNLPFTATTASVTKHFAAVKPISVRALTEKDNPAKSKGIAFIEFEGYDHMKTCLKLFHHSTFDDGLSAPRKINVELTAGGGGKANDRKAKIRDKNQKLNEERARRMQEEAKVKLEKSTNAAAIDESAIHPSRRMRVPGL